MVSKVSLTKLVAFIGKFGVLPNLLFSIFNQVGLSTFGCDMCVDLSVRFLHLKDGEFLSLVLFLYHWA